MYSLVSNINMNMPGTHNMTKQRHRNGTKKVIYISFEMCLSLFDGFVYVPLCLRYGWMLGLRSSSPMPSAWVASPRWEATTNTTTTATSKD